MRFARYFLLVCAWAPGLLAQGETVTVSKPRPELVQLGETCVVDIVVRGESANPKSPRIPRVDGLQMGLSGPQRSQSIQIINGRRTADSKVTYQLQIKPTRTGRFEIPAFTMNTGTGEHAIGPITIDVEKDLAGQSRGFFELSSVPQQVYVNEPLQFVFDYGVDNRLSLTSGRARNGQTYHNVYVDAPWFDAPERVVAAEGVDDISGGQTVNLVFNGGLQPVAYTSDFQREGTAYHRFTFTKTYLPTEPGRIVIDGPVMAFEVSKGRGRADMFGMRRDRTETLRVYGEPVEVEVLPIPTEGRPAGYRNAVGRFTVEASTDKPRVRVGDSIKLTLAIRGPGNTEFLDPPVLGQLDGFHLLGQNENRDRALVEVTYDLTPLREDVGVIPAVEFSFFDTTPGVERFVTVATEPLRIEVEPAPEGEGLTVLPGEEEAAVVAGVDDIFDMKAIDGATIPLDAAPGRGVGGLLLIAPWLLCGLLAVLWRGHRRRSADVRGRRAAGAARKFRSAVGDDAVEALVGYPRGSPRRRDRRGDRAGSGRAARRGRCRSGTGDRGAGGDRCRHRGPLRWR